MAKLTCDGCDAMCCRYVATEIDAPEDKEDYDHIIWYLLHENIHVFIEEKEWYIQFNTPCEKIDRAGKCSFYDKRPKICKELNIKYCEKHGKGDPQDYLFKTPEDFIEYMKEKGIDI
jgi:hypothetical protein